jgi:hypothetical protein
MATDDETKGKDAPLANLSALRLAASHIRGELVMPMTSTPIRDVLLALIGEVEAARAASPSSDTEAGR